MFIIKACSKQLDCNARGGGLVFQAGYHPHIKEDFENTPMYFSGMKIDPKLVPMVTALLLRTVTGEVTEPHCIRTNQKFHHKFSVFECMKIAQNYAQVSLPLSDTIQYSKMLIFCWKAIFH